MKKERKKKKENQILIFTNIYHRTFSPSLTLLNIIHKAILHLYALKL